MDLLERYLQSVRTFLPRKGQDDIVRELSENILCQMEEKEAVLGRPLTNEEQTEMLKLHGHPVVVAARYGRAHYLIGPTIFPFYWLTLRIAIAGTLLVSFIVAITMASLSPDPTHAILPALLNVPSVLVPVFCWFTATFAAIEWCSTRFNFKADWNPATLPAIRKDLRSIPRTESTARIVFGGLGILWWQALPVAPFLLFGPAAWLVAPAPVWTTLHWPILLLIVAGVVQSSVDLAQPHLGNVRVAMRLLLRAAELAVLSLVLRADSWVVVAPGVHDPAQYAKAMAMANRGVFYGLLAGLVVGGVQLAWDCYKQWRNSSAHGLFAQLYS